MSSAGRYLRLPILRSCFASTTFTKSRGIYCGSGDPTRGARLELNIISLEQLLFSAFSRMDTLKCPSQIARRIPLEAGVWFWSINIVCDTREHPARIALLEYTFLSLI